MGTAKSQKLEIKYLSHEANLFLKEDANYINSTYIYTAYCMSYVI